MVQVPCSPPLDVRCSYESGSRVPPVLLRFHHDPASHPRHASQATRPLDATRAPHAARLTRCLTRLPRPTRLLLLPPRPPPTRSTVFSNAKYNTAIASRPLSPVLRRRSEHLPLKNSHLACQPRGHFSSTQTDLFAEIKQLAQSEIEHLA
ncbi:hypothetical protein C8J57DRAFT_1528555 [Mycena rebaudengoi]|nr:hypothetical protein C8J57DRAFT_1528555 [Mycena rebaudengoi]